MLLGILEPLFTEICKGGRWLSQHDGGRTGREKCSVAPTHRCVNVKTLEQFKTGILFCKNRGFVYFKHCTGCSSAYIKNFSGIRGNFNTAHWFLGSLKDFKYAQIFTAPPTNTRSHNPSSYRRDFWFGCIMFAYEKQKVCSCCGGGGGGGGREEGGGGRGLLLGLCHWLKRPKTPPWWKQESSTVCVERERERGGREGENKAVEQLDRHLLGVYARL